MALQLSFVGKPTEVVTYSYTWKEPVLYALGIGARKDELDYLYEGKGPKVYPSFAVVPSFPAMFNALVRLEGNLAMVVHGGEKVVIHKPFAPAGTLKTVATVRAIYDLRKFASVIVDMETKDEKNELVAVTTGTIIYRGEGGFGGDPPPKDEAAITVPKDRPADFQVEEVTSPEQALLYRLSGDINPLHADPEFAKMAGFADGPILHGLCTYGYMIRHLAKAACGGDASKITAFEAQFRKPVWPGDTLVTSGWKLEPGKIALSVGVKGKNDQVITNAWATLKE
jgi:acyl dehydratase